MVLNMPTQTLVLIIVALILLALGLAAVATASGMSVPLFDQIGGLLKGLSASS